MGVILNQNKPRLFMRHKKCVRSLNGSGVMVMVEDRVQGRGEQGRANVIAQVQKNIKVQITNCRAGRVGKRNGKAPQISMTILSSRSSLSRELTPTVPRAICNK